LFLFQIFRIGLGLIQFSLSLNLTDIQNWAWVDPALSLSLSLSTFQIFRIKLGYEVRTFLVSTLQIFRCKLGFLTRPDPKQF